jgi:predicted nuclease of predicted toxin-antitoxin system
LSSLARHSELVRVLLDESLPRPWGRELSGVEVVHVVDLGWAGVKNGELLRRASAEGFAALVTADRNMPFQQNLKHAGVGVIVVRAASTRIQALRPHAAALLMALQEIEPGELRIIGG